MPIPPVDTLVKYESPIMVRLRSLRAPIWTPPALPPQATSHRVLVPSTALARRDQPVSIADCPPHHPQITTKKDARIPKSAKVRHVAGKRVVLRRKRTGANVEG